MFALPMPFEPTPAEQAFSLRDAFPTGDNADACWNEATAALLAGHRPPT